MEVMKSNPAVEKFSDKTINQGSYYFVQSGTILNLNHDALSAVSKIRTPLIIEMK